MVMPLTKFDNRGETIVYNCESFEVCKTPFLYESEAIH